MTIRVALQHNTYYKFDRHVNLSPHVIRLRPAPHSRTPIHAYSLKVKPETHFINWQQDAFGNYLARLVFPEKTTELSIEVEVIADMTVINPFDFFLDDYAENYPFSYDKQSKKELKPYLEKIVAGPLLTKWLASISSKKRRTIDYLVELNSRLQQEISYSIRMEPGVQAPEETLERKIGSCRDTAWLLVQILRHQGLAARFASGYLVQLKQDEKSLDGPSGTEKDFTDLHAWCEVYLPGAGWVGLDPTSGLFASEGHIPLACTPDPVSAAPITGASDKSEVKFSHSNEVTRIHEDPRVTKPYSEEQWQQVLALGNFVDAEYQANDVRLTMGGEPTFVSIDDMESVQWNTAALGTHKLSLAKGLLLKLRDHFAPHGLLHYGQGKWYPGEEVPRWALGLFWRSDGEAFWKNAEYLARVDKDYGFDFKSAHKFSSLLASLLNIEDEYVQACYEDALYYLLEEQRVPINIDLLAAKVKDDLGRRRLARLLEKGLDKPTGFVIPLEMLSFPNHWRSSKWETRRGRLVLIPGDSPMGLRLPLNSLPWSEEYETFEKYLEPQDPFAPREALQKRDNILFQGGEEQSKNEALIRQAEETPHERATRKQDEALRTKVTGVRNVLRTALCIEAREGKIYLFMPPLPTLEQYVALIAAIEECAKQLKMPVVIEGYEPPRDYRVTKLLVTPDPGVIEVNIHPANNWQELVNTTTELYRVARESRLGTEKFMLDGRHTGTGGGNHITLGGKTPADSPMLRRPDLLRSLVTYWQHHPSLSYLFSGAFIGPTSQAPRADEGRDEMLYELEVAFKQMPEGLNEQPWLIDRLMRNLLIDITGNTHRAEFCIDKLYAPGSPTGRLGLLEFRGFEMPPHSRMALVQALLLRCLVARFWKAPYKKPLVRWGTLLHDKFMLPHYIWEDMRSVIADLQEHGYQFELEWMLPFLEFRFPHYGRTRIDNVELELSWAIEPWHVLGEEIGSFGTARYVDSSVERVQVKAKGLVGERHVLVCNGRRIPLNPTSVKGEYVAGVRYKAWAPPSALHPTIGVHTPLVFDLIDTWNGMAVGGFTYHVSHPGGRSYDTYPVNVFEAESRRISRYEGQGFTQGPFMPRASVDALREFFPQGYAPRPMSPPEEGPNEEFPHTLDLRRRAD